MPIASIRKTGSYSVQAADPIASHNNSWLAKRLQGKELKKLKIASLQQLDSRLYGLGQIITCSRLYRIVANHIKQAVPGFTVTTAPFKEQH